MVICGKRYVLKNRTRFTSVMVLFVLLICGIFWVGSVAGEQRMPSNTITESIHEQRQVEYIVKPGDTLWQIAKEHRQDQEIRSYIAAIMKANSMNDAYIRQGDRIILP